MSNEFVYEWLRQNVPECRAISPLSTWQELHIKNLINCIASGERLAIEFNPRAEDAYKRKLIRETLEVFLGCTSPTPPTA